jgi:hypothetical protein
MVIFREFFGLAGWYGEVKAEPGKELTVFAH